MSINKLSIVIPVYNESETFMDIFSQVETVDIGEIEKEIVIVNDASTDGTTDILRDLEQQKGSDSLKFVFKDVNEGKGFALRDGFAHTTGDYVIVQDADLEYDPNDYRVLIDALEREHVDVVYGSRFSGDYKDMTTLHYVGNKFLTFLTNLLFGVALSDMETCYKLLPGDFIRGVQIDSARFDFEPEITAKVLNSGLKIKEVPISYAGRSHSEGKKITWRDGIVAVWTLFKYKFLK